MLAYTLSRLLTQQAAIQRDMAGQDEWGADAAPDWQDLATVPCLLAWARVESGEGVNHTYVNATRTVPIEDGTILMASGTDITEADRISQVTGRDTGTVIYGGIIQVSSVIQQPDHIEVGVVRAHLGV